MKLKDLAEHLGRRNFLSKGLLKSGESLVNGWPGWLVLVGGWLCHNMEDSPGGLSDEFFRLPRLKRQLAVAKSHFEEM